MNQAKINIKALENVSISGEGKLSKEKLFEILNETGYLMSESEKKQNLFI